MNEGDKIIKIVIVQRHTLGRELLRLLIERRSDFVVVGGGRNCLESIELLKSEQPHILIIDTDLHDDELIDFLPILKAVSPGTRTLVLTNRCEMKWHREAIRRGASGLFLKDHGCELLIKAIEKVNAGEIWLDNRLISSVVEEMAQNNVAGNADAQLIASLTNRELEVVRAVGAGLKTREIALHFYISEKTVRNHLVSIFSKLRVSHRTELVAFARKNKLID